MLKNKMLRLNMQYFAEGNPEGNSGNSPGSEGSEGSEGGATPKTFTQEELNSFLKKERENSKRAILKELGVEDTKSAKESLTKYREMVDKGKSDEDKIQDTLKQETDARVQAEKKALQLEAKVEALSANCNPEYLDDIILMAQSKVTEDKGLSEVIKEMKESSKYAYAFGGSSLQEDKGTGGGLGFRKESNPKMEEGSLGASLAMERHIRKKNPYFND